MKSILTLLVLLACGAEVCGFGHGSVGGPELCKARIDGKQMVQVRLFSGDRMQIFPNTVLLKNDKGEMVPHSVKMGMRTLEETVVTLPVTVVKGYDTEGKPITRSQLAEMLAKESPVVVVVGEPKLEQLKPYRNGIVVLSVPVSLRGHGYAYYGGGPVIVAPTAPAEPPKKSGE